MNKSIKSIGFLLVLICSSVLVSCASQMSKETTGREDTKEYSEPNYDKGILPDFEEDFLQNKDIAFIITVDEDGKKSIFGPKQAKDIAPKFCSDGKINKQYDMCAVFKERLFLKDVSVSRSITMSGSPKKMVEEVFPGVFIEWCYDPESGQPVDCKK